MAAEAAGAARGRETLFVDVCDGGWAVWREVDGPGDNYALTFAEGGGPFRTKAQAEARLAALSGMASPANDAGSGPADGGGR